MGEVSFIIRCVDINVYSQPRGETQIPLTVHRLHNNKFFYIY